MLPTARDKITVRIHQSTSGAPYSSSSSKMKRSSDRDTPPRKRSRSSIGRYDDSSDERITPERGGGSRRRRSTTRGRSPPSPRAPPPRYNISPPLPSSSSSHHHHHNHHSSTHHRGGGGDEYHHLRGGPPPSERTSSSSVSSNYPYKVLCVSALHSKASDEVIKDTLYREYKKFGDLSIRLVHDLDERLAYVCFRNAEDAREAKHAKPRVIIYDKVALVEAVYETRTSNSDMYRSRPRSVTPEYDRHYYARSPERLRPPVDRYERAYGPPPGGIPLHREYRREAIPAPHHHHHQHDPYMARPPMHHHHQQHHHPGMGAVVPGGHMQPTHYGPPRPRPPFEKIENKKDKFPNYLHHVQPENDPLATRTLFAGNLEINITEEELHRIFGRYGSVEDIDIKRPPPGTGNAFAFVRFSTLDMAHKAKVELSGQYIGKFQCKIGYGKATPTTRIWVGGLGPWTSVPQLEREFDRFGAIKKIDYTKGDNHAFILYDSIDAAQAAVKDMRGAPLGGPDKRLRTDFADVNPGGSANNTGASGNVPYRPKPPPSSSSSSHAYQNDHSLPDYRRGGTNVGGGGEYPDHGGNQTEYEDQYRYRRGGGAANSYNERVPRRYPPTDGGNVGTGGGGNNSGAGDDDWNNRGGSNNTRGGDYKRSSLDRSRSRTPHRHSPDSDSPDSGSRRAGLLASSRTLPEVARKCTTIWQGALILKNSLFPAKFHLIDGDTDIVDGLMKDEDGKHQLRITQRLRLDQPKLEDVQRRISGASSHAIFLGLAGSTASVTNDDASVQTRPLRNLVSYLKQKEAAGVISLLNKETEATGVLYSFPPCSFSTELLKRTCPNLSEEAIKEDHLIIVVEIGDQQAIMNKIV